jgi:hypothetical protein
MQGNAMPLERKVFAQKLSNAVPSETSAQIPVLVMAAGQHPDDT